jgi:FkbM family methyltransferase
MEIIKKLIRKSPLYPVILSMRERKAILEWSEHDDKSAAFYSQFISENDICFDIGANVGNRTKVFLKIAKNVVAVEPQIYCYQKLEKFFSNHIGKKLHLHNLALGEKPGEAEMFISKVSTLSTLSQEWIDSTKKSGRFEHCDWEEKQKVKISTLDKIIEEHGKPSFIKIDVEGFELEVLKGLTQPVGVVSIEFAAEFLDKTLDCINHLASIGEIELNISEGETMEMSYAKWLSLEEMISTLRGYEGNFEYFGDVYIRFK